MEKGQPEKRLDKNRVESLILDLTWVKAKEFLEGEQESPEWGLKEPAYRVRLTGGGKEKKDERLWIGAEAGGKGFYARSGLHPSTLIIEGAHFEEDPRRSHRMGRKTRSGEGIREFRKAKRVPDGQSVHELLKKAGPDSGGDDRVVRP